MRKRINSNPNASQANEITMALQGMLQEFKQAGEMEFGDVEFKTEIDRYKVDPPPAPPKNLHNPDGIVDIITFCEHPYFLNLKLTPWQKIILKAFYMGTHGNSHLKINDEYKKKGCDGCVWANYKESEIIRSQQIREGVMPNPELIQHHVHPCVNCSRFDQEDRNIIQEYIEKSALTEAQAAPIKEWRKQEPTDNYKTEMQLLTTSDVDKKVVDQITRKLGLKFFELVLILGRRSGKSYLVCVIALYEVYKLLAMGHPQGRIASANEFDEFTICNVAVSESQAKKAIFNPMSQFAGSSPFFSQHIGNQTSLEIHFLTEHDKKENRRRAELGQTQLTGTIQIVCGHSNSAALVGRSMVVVIIDEMAVMAQKGGDGADYDLYDQLKPAIATFGLEYGKIICISNPLGPMGKLYDLYNTSFNDDSMLMFKLPTWVCNPLVTHDYLAQEKQKDPIGYNMFYGAQFGDSGLNPWMPSEYIDNVFGQITQRKRATHGDPGKAYYMHVDPANTSDLYTIVIVHPEESLKMSPDGSPQVKIVVDYIHYFEPVNGHKIDSSTVDAHIIDLSQKFYLKQITYDQWDSHNSIKKLQDFGLNAKCTVYNGSYKDKIYGELYELIYMGLIEFYDLSTMVSDPQRGHIDLNEVEVAKTQFKMLQTKMVGGRKKIMTLPGYHDDIPDAVAGAAYNALKEQVFRKPFRGRAVALPIYNNRQRGMGVRMGRRRF